MEMSRVLLKKGWVLLFAVMLTLGFSGCSSLDFLSKKEDKTAEKETQNTSDVEEMTSAEKNEKSEKKLGKKNKNSVKSESQNKVKTWNKEKAENNKKNSEKKNTKKSNKTGTSGLLTEKEAKQAIIKGVKDHIKNMEPYGLESAFDIPTADQLRTLEEVPEESVEQKNYDLGFNMMREKYPGPYQQFFYFYGEESEEMFQNPKSSDMALMVSFYVNLRTGMVFSAYQDYRIYRLPDGAIMGHIPYVNMNYADFQFMLAGLYEAGVISNMDQYVWEWYWKAREEETSLKEYTTGNEVQFGLFDKDSKELFGIYKMDVESKLITEAESGRFIYQDSRASYSSDNQEMSPDEAVAALKDILEKLEILDFEKADYQFKTVGNGYVPMDATDVGYEIEVYEERDSKSIGTYIIRIDGLRVMQKDLPLYRHNIIYGNFIPPMQKG